MRWFKPLETSVTISLAYTVDQVKLSSLLDILALGNYTLYTFSDELKKTIIGYKSICFRSGSPTPIEFLPAQNILDSRVRLLIMYQGRPTITIAVGDPLTFKLESLQGYNLIAGIFATNVIAKDPYTGKSVQLIDRFGYLLIQMS